MRRSLVYVSATNRLRAHSSELFRSWLSRPANRSHGLRVSALFTTAPRPLALNNPCDIGHLHSVVDVTPLGAPCNEQ